MMADCNDKAVYPLFAVASAVIILLTSLLLAPKHGYIYLICVVLLEIIFGMGKYVLKILPVAVIISAVYFALSYLITRSLADGISGATRIAGVCAAMVPGMSIPPVNLTRALNGLKCPRMLSLGILITLRFFPLLAIEIKNIREAMKTRGADSSITTLYRSTILPFCLRLVNISDLLALSVETRGFSTEGNYTVWKKISVRPADILYLVIMAAACAAAVVYLPKMGAM